MLPQMDVTEPHVLGLQATQWIKRIFGASADQGLSAAHLGPGDAEVAEKQVKGAGPLCKPLVELLKLRNEGIGKFAFLRAPSERCLARIRKYCNRNIVKLDEFRSRA